MNLVMVTSKVDSLADSDSGSSCPRQCLLRHSTIPAYLSVNFHVTDHSSSKTTQCRSSVQVLAAFCIGDRSAEPSCL